MTLSSTEFDHDLSPDRHDHSDDALLVEDEHLFSASEDEDELNDAKVREISCDFFYTPHTVTLMAIVIIVLTYFAFCHAPTSPADSIYYGVCGTIFCFLALSTMICPNGPFTRPHPVFWQLVLATSIVYLLFLCFLLFQDYSHIMDILQYLSPELKYALPDTKIYKVDCDKFSKFIESFDIFIIAHFMGYFGKAVVLRHAGILWLVSVMWEVTEMFFIHLLPNFAECWWDSLILDIFLCNGLGIYCGLAFCRLLDIRGYTWESFKAAHGAKKKFKRVILQFTPRTLDSRSWLAGHNPLKRYLYLCLLLIFFMVSELNVFFLKHIFVVPSKHYFNLIRLILIILLVAPSLRQYYMFISDPRCKRIGSHFWVFMSITFVELLVCIKNGRDLFKKTIWEYVIVWLFVQFIISFIVLAVLMGWTNIKRKVMSFFVKIDEKLKYKKVYILKLD